MACPCWAMHERVVILRGRSRVQQAVFRLPLMGRRLLCIQPMVPAVRKICTHLPRQSSGDLLFHESAGTVGSSEAERAGSAGADLRMQVALR